MYNRDAEALRSLTAMEAERLKGSLGRLEPRDIDVVILSLGRVEQTLEALRSVASQRDVFLNCLVIDQGSAPSDRDRLNAACAIYGYAYVETAENLGVAGGRNIGIDLTSSEFIFFLDNDAEFGSDDALWMLLRSARSDSRIGILTTRIDNFYTGDLDLTSWGFPTRRLRLAHAPWPAKSFLGGASIVRRAVFSNCGSFDSGLFFYWEELDLAYRLALTDYLIVYLPIIRIRHKVSPESRLDWTGPRFYFYVRNRLAIEMNYGRRAESLARAAGYLILALRTRNFRSYIAAIVDIRKLRHKALPRARRAISQRIRAVEGSARGSHLTELVSGLRNRTKTMREMVGSQ